MYVGVRFFRAGFDGQGQLYLIFWLYGTERHRLTRKSSIKKRTSAISGHSRVDGADDAAAHGRRHGGIGES